MQKQWLFRAELTEADPRTGWKKGTVLKLISGFYYAANGKEIVLCGVIGGADRLSFPKEIIKMRCWTGRRPPKGKKSLDSE